MGLKITNKATSLLASSINTSVGSLAVTSSTGGRFPTLGAGDWFPLVVVNAAGATEIMRCTGRSGDVLTVTRAQEGTSAIAFTAGAVVDLRLTAAAFTAMFDEQTAAYAAAAAAAETLAIARAGAVGQCYLEYSGGLITLRREKGRFLHIDGQLVELPDTPLSLAASGASAGIRYIYAARSGSTPGLEHLATGYELDPDRGILVCTDDDGLTFVGLGYASATDTWSTSQLLIASLFNPTWKSGAGSAISGTLTHGSSFVECHATSRLPFLTLAGREVRMVVSGEVQSPSAAQDITVDIGLDGVTAQLGGASKITRLASDFSVEIADIFGDVSKTVSEGFHYATPIGKISGSVNGGTFLHPQVTILG